LDKASASSNEGRQQCEIRFESWPRWARPKAGDSVMTPGSRTGHLTQINNPGSGAMRLKVEGIASAVNL
jgi:hypothetical protein